VNKIKNFNPPEKLKGLFGVLGTKEGLEGRAGTRGRNAIFKMVS